MINKCIPQLYRKTSNILISFYPGAYKVLPTAWPTSVLISFLFDALWIIVSDPEFRFKVISQKWTIS